MTKFSVSIIDGASKSRLTLEYLLTLAELIEKGYGIGPDVRKDLATWLRATAEGKDLRRVMGLLRRPKVDRPWWMGLDYLVRYRISGNSKAAAGDVASDWGLRGKTSSKTVIEAYADRRAELDDELKYQLSLVPTADQPAALVAWKHAIAHKRESTSRKKSAQLIRLNSRVRRRKQA